MAKRNIKWNKDLQRGSSPRAGRDEDPMRRKPWQNNALQRGFTLLEVMLCLAILAIAIPAFLAAVVQNVTLEQMNSELNIAVNAACGVIEDVHTLGYSEVLSANLPPTFEATGLTSDGHTVKLTSRANSTQVGRVTITENATRMVKTVQVAITWRGITGGDRTIQLVTEVTNY